MENMDNLMPKIFTNFSQQLQDLQELSTYIDIRAKELANLTVVDRYESEEIKDIAGALAKASGEFPPITFNRESSWFQAEYSDLDNIMIKIRPILAKYGLSVSFFFQIDDKTVLHTRVRHESGQWIESRIRFIPSRDDLKTMESALNHIKRQQIQALLNITVAGDLFDDDAVVEMTDKRKEVTGGNPVTKITAQDTDKKTITKEQASELEYELADNLSIAEELLKAYRIQHIADLPYSKYQSAITKVRMLKQLTQ